MDYYEEFGVGRSAHPEEIRRALRRLSKLVHPDQQTDPILKSLAETQMRRLNSMATVLLNPDQRRKYDLEQSLPALHRARGLAIGQTIYAVPVRPVSRHGFSGGFASRTDVRPPSAEAMIKAGYRTSQEVALWSVLSASAAVLITLSAVWAWSGQKFGTGNTAAYVLVERNDSGELAVAKSRCEPTPADRQILQSLTATKASIVENGAYVPPGRASKGSKALQSVCIGPDGERATCQPLESPTLKHDVPLYPLPDEPTLERTSPAR